MASSVELGDFLEKFVDSLVKSGRYNSRSEVMREGIRIIHERETKLAELDASIMRGLEDSAQGRFYTADEVMEKIKAKISSFEKK